MPKDSTLAAQAYERLRVLIVTGRLPAGSPLRLAALSEQLGLSMAVVREALTRLAEQGLAVAQPNQGFRVISLSAQDLRELTELRVTLEVEALRASIERGDLAWEGRVVSAHHVLEATPLPAEPGSRFASPTWIAAHAAFHEALTSGCGNARLLTLVATLRDGSEIYRQWAGTSTERDGRDVAAEHRELMELTVSRLSAEAGSALAAHICRTTDLLLRAADVTQPA